MLHEPRRSGRPQPGSWKIARAREAPGVGDVVRDESPRAVVNARRLPARLAQRLEEVEQRQMRFREVGDLGRPVVHLQVDVEVIVAVPRRAHAVVPQALQIRGQIAGPAACGEQIAAVLEVQRFESQVPLAALHAFEPFVGRLTVVSGFSRTRVAVASGFSRTRAQPQRHTPEQTLVVGDVAGAKLLVALGGRSRQLALAPFIGLDAAEAGRGCHQDRDRFGVLHQDALGIRLEPASVGYDLHGGSEREALTSRQRAREVQPVVS